MKYLWIITAHSNKAKQTIREFALDGTVIGNQAQAKQRAEAFAARLSSVGHNGAVDWTAGWKYEPVGMSTLGT